MSADVFPCPQCGHPREVRWRSEVDNRPMSVGDCERCIYPHRYKGEPTTNPESISSKLVVEPPGVYEAAELQAFADAAMTTGLPIQSVTTIESIRLTPALRERIQDAARRAELDWRTALSNDIGLSAAITNGVWTALTEGEQQQ